jgi:hypothetical protein
MRWDGANQPVRRTCKFQGSHLDAEVRRSLSSELGHEYRRRLCLGVSPRPLKVKTPSGLYPLIRKQIVGFGDEAFKRIEEAHAALPGEWNGNNNDRAFPMVGVSAYFLCVQPG